MTEVCFEQGMSWSDMRLKHLCVIACISCASFSTSAMSMLVGVEGTTGQLYAVDTSNGSLTPIGPTGGGLLVGLTYDPSGDVLYSVNLNAPASLFTLNSTLGTSSLVGSLGVGSIGSLAFDSNAGILYGASFQTLGSLVTIDTTTGAASAVGPQGIGLIGMSYDPMTDTLYGASNSGGGSALYTVDTSTGAASIVGLISTSIIQALAFDTTTGTLYGADFTNSQLITIDTNTGVGSPVGGFGLSQVFGLTFLNPLSVPEPGTLALALPALLLVGRLQKRRRSLV